MYSTVNDEGTKMGVILIESSIEVSKPKENLKDIALKYQQIKETLEELLVEKFEISVKDIKINKRKDNLEPVFAKPRTREVVVRVTYPDNYSPRKICGLVGKLLRSHDELRLLAVHSPKEDITVATDYGRKRSETIKSFKENGYRKVSKREEVSKSSSPDGLFGSRSRARNKDSASSKAAKYRDEFDAIDMDDSNANIEPLSL